MLTPPSHPPLHKHPLLPLPRPALLGGGGLAYGAPPPPSPSALAGWAAGQWEALQLYLLGTARGPPSLPRALRVG
jgi:hypothetical protein